jgi:hypothetical protein
MSRGQRSGEEGTLQMVLRELVNVLFDSHKYSLAASLSEL